MEQHPSRNNYRANVYCGTAALLLALLSFLLFYLARSFYHQPMSFSQILSHPLMLAMAGISSKWGADIGLYFFKLKCKYVSIQHKSDCRLISFWIFSVFVFLSLLQLFSHGLAISP